MAKLLTGSLAGYVELKICWVAVLMMEKMEIDAQHARVVTYLFQRLLHNLKHFGYSSGYRHIILARFWSLTLV